MPLSMNEQAYLIVKDLLGNPSRFHIEVETLPNDATLIDAGREVQGGYEMGLKITEILLGGLGRATLGSKSFGNVEFPTVFVHTNYPAFSLLGSQLAGWKIEVGDFSAIASGPIRALARKPKDIFKTIDYTEESDVGIIAIETEEKPTEEIAEYISEKSGVDPENLYIITIPTNSIAGMTQIAGRIVETGLFKLNQLDFDPRSVLFGEGYAPIMPLHPDSTHAMARGNDGIHYGGVISYTVNFKGNDEELRQFIKQSPSSASEDYGKPFYDVYKEAGFDLYEIDPSLFAPAVITVTNKRTGTTYKAGQVNPEVIKRSTSLKIL